MQTRNQEDFEIKAGDSVARFSSLGAECLAWSVGSQRLTWQPDASVWPSVCPVLFPVCGWSRNGEILIDGQVYPMPVHGIAPSALFEPRRLSESEIGFRLEADDATRESYPFEFAFDVTYRLGPGDLTVTMKIENKGARPMPYACGLHPGFRWSAQPGSHWIEFEADEKPEVPQIAPGGLFSTRMRPVSLNGQRLSLSRDLFANEALCFLDTVSRRFRYKSPGGCLEVYAPDFPHLILWSRAPGEFLAIESWTGTGDPDGSPADFFERPSMIHLGGGESRQHRLMYSWTPAGNV